MYKLTKEQKIANYREILGAKEEKLKNLTKEVENLRKKIQKLQESK